MALPEFLGIGAMKAASSLLFELLSEHPGVCTPAKDIKEVRFFNRYYDRGVDWYSSLFQPRPGQIPGEVTPDYLYRRDCAPRIASVVPSAKLIAILRDPVKRTYSQFTHFVQESGYRASFGEFLADHPNAVGRSLYHAQIQRYLQHFRREQIQLLLFEEFTRAPLAAMAEVYRFIGVDPAFVPQQAAGKKVNATMPRNVGKVYAVGRRVTKRLADMGLEPVAKALRGTSLRDWLATRQSPQGKEDFPPMTADDRSRMLEQIVPDVALLEGLMGRDLRGVWKLDAKR